MRGRLTALPPLGAVLNDPVSQRLLEANIVARFFLLDPLVFEKFVTFGLKFTIE